LVNDYIDATGNEAPTLDAFVQWLEEARDAGMISDIPSVRTIQNRLREAQLRWREFVDESRKSELLRRAEWPWHGTVPSRPR
jgi:hypothetical protein